MTSVQLTIGTRSIGYICRMELLKKLRIKTGLPLIVLNAADVIHTLLPDVTIATRLGKTKPAPQLMLFAENSAELNKWLPKVADYIRHETLFWICYPKKTGSIPSDLIRMNTWDIVFSSGYRAQTSVSIDDDWTAMRFTNAPKKETLADLPPKERKVPGIDFVERTVQLPVDALKVLKQHPGTTEFFNSMSFSHKKEHVIAIEEAKKPETRARRIVKMAEMLQQMMLTKEAKAQSKKKR